MAQLSYRKAVSAAIAQEMRRDPNVVFLGEDIAEAGGVFKATEGLLDEFGPERVKDTPISEQAIVGAAMGAAMTGLKPIAEIISYSSFSQEPEWFTTAPIFSIKKLIKDGADIIDVGAESTRPGAKDIDSKKEWKRVKSKLNYLSKQKCFISLDTRKSSIIKKSLFYKVGLINDISGLDYDKESLNILKNYKIPFVLHHIQGTPNTMQKNPSYNNVLLDIYDYFEKKLKQIRANKIKHNNIILDPGIGFGKNLKHNITLISQISIFHSLGYPIMLGLSKKRFIKDLSGVNDSRERIGGTISSCLYSTLQGVQILRIHDVNEVRQALKVFKKLQFN